jgi:hypothetical protein
MIGDNRPGHRVGHAVSGQPVELKQQAVPQITGANARRADLSQNPDDPFHGGHLSSGDPRQFRYVLGQVASFVQARHDGCGDPGVASGDHEPQVPQYCFGPRGARYGSRRLAYPARVRPRRHPRRAGLLHTVRARRVGGHPAGAADMRLVLDERGVPGEFGGYCLLKLGARQGEQFHVCHERRRRYHPDFRHQIEASTDRHRSPCPECARCLPPMQGSCQASRPTARLVIVRYHERSVRHADLDLPWCRYAAPEDAGQLTPMTAGPAISRR